jgi:chlorophyll synthase
MALAQAAVIVMLFAWDRPIHAIAIAALLAVQIGLMPRLLRDPRKLAPWYNGTGVSLYVLGMVVSAFALAGLGT